MFSRLLNMQVVPGTEGACALVCVAIIALGIGELCELVHAFDLSVVFFSVGPVAVCAAGLALCAKEN